MESLKVRGEGSSLETVGKACWYQETLRPGGLTGSLHTSGKMTEPIWVSIYSLLKHEFIPVASFADLRTSHEMCFEICSVLAAGATQMDETQTVLEGPRFPSGTDRLAVGDRPALQDAGLQGSGPFRPKRAQWELRPRGRSKYILQAGSVPCGSDGYGQSRKITEPECGGDQDRSPFHCPIRKCEPS